MADRDHKKLWRHFAHSLHQQGEVCFARAAEKELTDEEMAGIMAHELGHIVAERLGLPAHKAAKKAGKTPKSVQREADAVSRDIFGLKIRYNYLELEEIPLLALEMALSTLR